ncbi:MAG: hypothetical protein J6N20_17930, partial [Pseudomonas sp.]|nr:hypothetical protein [Pseudomonas sp.]
MTCASCAGRVEKA